MAEFLALGVASKYTIWHTTGLNRESWIQIQTPNFCPTSESSYDNQPVVVVVVAPFFSHERVMKEGSTNHSPPAFLRLLLQVDICSLALIPLF